jgi:hypothetical protein
MSNDIFKAKLTTFDSLTSALGALVSMTHFDLFNNDVTEYNNSHP